MANESESGESVWEAWEQVLCGSTPWTLGMERAAVLDGSYRAWTDNDNQMHLVHLPYLKPMGADVVLDESQRSELIDRIAAVIRAAGAEAVSSGLVHLGRPKGRCKGKVYLKIEPSDDSAGVLAMSWSYMRPPGGMKATSAALWETMDRWLPRGAGGSDEEVGERNDDDIGECNDDELDFGRIQPMSNVAGNRNWV
ncbi:uncharacterized protein AMSG_04748 [Thecamonas trahens ATCC 50062]|uniref:Uncharacterized protein n=1 Tax=Thecamonas trahens ATCC 50062 TaxID=461836 RepID=A0A0L0D9S7_THETB|nr:hypothetical protein AMSG_04748 [Thecamonas trahens ATCC 50062]KNC49005.1 hypothetical protein AMSG_04748 [Thecamonas trahens ATCC 50062]|eukprot:XP_013758416.1 hypothetical protein AMSG_04748 [Thecamonas trahens ATCC 50062]